MRRAFLLAGIAGATVLFTSVAVMAMPSKDTRINAHLTKVREIAFCQKGYEIASSFPSYASRHVQDVSLKLALLHRADKLEAKSEMLNRVLEKDYKEEARKLGMDGVSYEAKLDAIKLQAEQDAVMAFQQTEEPLKVLGQLDEVCATHISE